MEHREDGRAAMRAGWEIKTLGEVCDRFVDGDWIESKDQSASGIRLIQTGNIGEGYFKDRDEKARYISEITFRRLRCTEIFKGDCLISRLPNPVGRSCILPETGVQMITAVDCTIVRLNRLCIIPEFFNYYSQSYDYLQNISQLCTGTTRNRISRSNLAKTPIPLPPLAEQQRIVAILDEAFEGIATARKHAEQNLQNAKTLFESHLQTTFTQSGQGWVEQKLGEISEFKNGLNYNKSSSGQTLPVVGVADFQDNYSVPFSELQSATIDGHLAENYTIQPNDILTVRSNGSKHLVGRCMLVGHVDEAVSYSGFIIRIRFDAETIFPQFLLHFMKCQVTRDILTAGGGGANINNINQEKLSSLIVPLPPYKIQIKIAADLDALRDETNRLTDIYTQKIAALDALKKSLLHQAFSGEL